MIMLIEDDTALRGALEELLCREGYEVIKASDARSAQSKTPKPPEIKTSLSSVVPAAASPASL